jgi:hypothetical protein
MAIIKCFNCGNFISDKAGICPKCGAQMTGQPPQTSGQGSSSEQAIIANSGNLPKKSNKGIIIGLCAALFLLLAGLVFILIKNNQDEQEAEQKLAEITAQHEQEKRRLAEKQAQVEAEKARLAEVERKRLEDEKRQEAARRKAAEAEAARRRAEAQVEVVNYNSATGVYTGVICGVKARMSIRQSGNNISGTYTGNTRNYNVKGTVDDYLNFDMNVGGGAIVNGQIDGRVMSGMWEELGSGKYYSFSLSR